MTEEERIRWLRDLYRHLKGATQKVEMLLVHESLREGINKVRLPLDNK